MFCLCFKCLKFLYEKNKNCPDTLNINTTHDAIVFTHALIRVFFIIRSFMSINVVQHRYAAGNFNSDFNFHKFKSKPDSLLGICPLLKNIVHVLRFYILNHVIPGLVTFSDDLLTGKFHRKPYIFQSIPSSYLIRLLSFMHFFWFYI